MLAPNFTANTPISSDARVEKTPSYTPDEVPSCGGHGTLEILEVTRFLERHGIECCIVGVSALMFYGAGRVRDVRDDILCLLYRPPLRRGREFARVKMSGKLTRLRNGIFVSPTTRSTMLPPYSGRSPCPT